MSPTSTFKEAGNSSNTPTVNPDARVQSLDASSIGKVEREEDPTRKQILAAMQRLLLGHPKHVPIGANSISDLAKEAQVGRHHLYQRYTDLRARYEYLRDRADQSTEKELELQRALDRGKAEMAKARVLQANAREEAKNWKGLAELLAQAVNVLQEELRQEEDKTRRLTRRLQALEDQNGQAPIVLMHRRKDAESSRS